MTVVELEHLPVECVNVMKDGNVHAVSVCSHTVEIQRGLIVWPNII